MKIKEIIDRERWCGFDEFEEYGDLSVAHSMSLDRIEAAVMERITELEAQVPKAVKPQKRRHVSGSYWLCDCETCLDGIAQIKYCPWCGSKLNWEKK